ncbi:MAG: endonuclease [Pirellulaceae bacterium]|nr:endonuclease [Pirellulaceae bacterium]
MKHRSTLWIVLAAVSLISSFPSSSLFADQPATIRVLTYNIHHGEGVDGKLDLDRIANVIRSASPDVVFLQEVDQNAKRSDDVDQPAELAKLTGMHVVFGANIPLQGGHYGNAILSKFPITESDNVLLPNRNDGEQRGVLTATTMLGGMPVRIYATHFDHRRNDEERYASAKRVNELVGQQPPEPALFGGDINDVRSSRVIKELQKEWRIAGNVEQPTIPVGNPERQIDFVFSRPSNRWKTSETKVLGETVASDHRPLLVILELTPVKSY